MQITITGLSRITARFLWFLIFSIWLLGGCGSPPPPTPVSVVGETPTFSDPKVSAPTPQEPGREIGIAVDVSSATGVSLTYEWRADGGEIIRGQNSPAITYRTPDEPGVYFVRVNIKWGNNSVEKMTSIQVESPTVVVIPPTDTPSPMESQPPTNTPFSPTHTPTKSAVDTPKPTPVPIEVTATSTVVASTGKRYGQVTDVGGIDDKGFNQLAWDGMLKTSQQLGVEVNYLESQQQSDYDKNISEFINQGYDGIVTVGFLLADATKKASETHPEFPIAIVDFPSQTPNDMGLLFAVDEPSFLAGYLAAGMSKTDTVCTYGGIKIPPVVQFMVGFEQGVNHYNERNGTQVKLLGWTTDSSGEGGGEGSFTGNFESLEDGRSFAENFFDEGCDIIFPVAGPVGLGSAAAAKDRNFMVIGVDADLTQTAPEYKDVYLTSVLKKINNAVFAAIKEMNQGTFRGGTNYMGTLQNGGVGLAPFYDYEDKVPQKLRDDLEAIKSGIVNGEISTGLN